jgi:hypothetical protein
MKTDRPPASAKSVQLDVWNDAVQARCDDQSLGWFSNEMQATAAALEHLLMASAILPSLRQLPALTIQANYRDEWSHAKTITYKPAVMVRCGPVGRRVVRVPCSFGKPWMVGAAP